MRYWKILKLCLILLTQITLVTACGCQLNDSMETSLQVDNSTPQRLLETFDKAATSRDLHAMEHCMAPEGRSLFRKYMQSQISAASKAEELVHVVDEQFGEEVAIKVKKLFGLVFAINPFETEGVSSKTGLDWQKINVVVTDDKANIYIKGLPPRALTLQKIDGHWYLDPANSRYEITSEDTVRWYKNIFTTAEEFAAKIIKAIKSGDITSVEELNKFMEEESKDGSVFL